MMNSPLPLPLSLWSRLLTMGCVLLALLNTSKVQAQPAPAASAPKKAAIFVDNKAGKEFESKVSVFEDFIASRITTKGFSVISHAQTVRAIGKESNLDKELENNTSALRLAQSLGADYLIVASISSYGTEKRDFEDGAVKTLNIISTMRASYRVLEVVQGGSLVGDTLKAVKVIRGTPNAGVVNDDVVNELLDELSQKIAENLGQKQAGIAAMSPASGQVEVTITCNMADLGQVPITVPDIQLTTNGVVVGKTSFEVQALDVSVEVNGVLVGSAPAKLKVPPGLNKLRLTREGFQPWERTVNFVDGQNLKIALQMSQQGYAKWKETTAFILDIQKSQIAFASGIAKDQKLTDAGIIKDQKLTDAKIEKERRLTEGEIEVLKGQAQMLRQSGFKVDVKIDTKEGIATTRNSIF